MANKTGRKSLRDEMAILKRYSDLSEPYFKVLKKHLESDNKDDQRWAADNLKSAFAKMIPQTIDGDGDDGEILIKVINYGSNPTVQLSTEEVPTTTPTSD